MSGAERASLWELEAFLASHPDVVTVDLLLPDLNGVLRGSRLGREQLAGLVRQGVSVGASTPLIDARGVLLGGLAFGEREGDPDQPCFPVPGSFAPVPWASAPRGQCLLQMFRRDGTPFVADSRQLLRRVVASLGALGLTPVVAVELEFYLLAAPDEPRPRPWLMPLAGTGLRAPEGQLHGIEVLEALESLLVDIHRACAAQGLPASNAMSESAPGQFEINLRHVADAALACDHAVLLRRLVRALARRHGLGATFMAKPFSGLDGSGMHVHVSLVDAAGRNAFADGDTSIPGAGFAPALRHAAGGLLATLPEALAVFAPNANSWRRLGAGHFVPDAAVWSSNHRAAAVRVPLADPANLRLEHRVAGADANPYLVVAAVLAGIHHGLTRGLEPPAMLREGEAYTPAGGATGCWEQAIAAFEAAEVLPRHFGESFCRLYAQVRRAEAAAYRAEVPDVDHAWYLGSF